MLRIAMISTPFIPVPPRDYGGTELIVHELVDGLLDRGHHVTLFATGDSHTRATLQALYQEAIWPPQPFAELDHVSWAMREVVRGGYDVVHDAHRVRRPRRAHRRLSSWTNRRWRQLSSLRQCCAPGPSGCRPLN